MVRSGEKGQREKQKKNKKKVSKDKCRVSVASASVAKNYRSNRQFNKWSEAAMANALNEFNAAPNASVNRMRTIARACGIPKSTLQRRLAGKINGFCHKSGRKPVMSKEAEDELADTIRMLASRGFPLGLAGVRKLARQYSILNNLNLFKKKAAGYYWFLCFMKRHRDLRLEKPEALSSARAIGIKSFLINLA